MNNISLSNRTFFPLYSAALFERCDNSDFVNGEGIKIHGDGILSYKDRLGQTIELELDEIIQGIIEVKAWNVQTNDIVHYFPIKYKNLLCQKCLTETTHYIGASSVCIECGSLHREKTI